MKPSGETYRDNIYFIILARVRKKYPTYTEKQLHAVTAALRAKAMETEKMRA